MCQGHVHEQAAQEHSLKIWYICRADNIIRDAEVVRKAMCQDTSSTCLWTLLGQSFGGFCAVSHLPLGYQSPVLSMEIAV